jgi:hypothetical protein
VAASDAQTKKPDPLAMLHMPHATREGPTAAAAATHLSQGKGGSERVEGTMICDHTNYLILGLRSCSVESRELIQWQEPRETLITPKSAWYEFLCGTVSTIQFAKMRACLHEVNPFDHNQSNTVAEVYNATSRNSSLRGDTMIAATGMTEGFMLATNHLWNLAAFTSHGLKLK